MRATEEQHYPDSPTDSEPGRAGLPFSHERGARCRAPVHRFNTRPGDLVPALPARMVLPRGDRSEPPDRARHPGARRPGRPSRLVRRRPPTAAAGLRRPVGQLVGSGRQRPRPAAVPRRAGRPRGAGALRGLAAHGRPGRDPRPDDAVAAVDGRTLDERVRGRSRTAPVRGDLRVRDLRQRAPVGPAVGRGRGRDQGLPRPGAHAGLRRAPRRHRRHRLPHLRGGLGRRRGGLHRRRPGRTPLPAPADVPAAADARGLRLPGVVGRRRRPPRARAGRRLSRGG